MGFGDFAMGYLVGQSFSGPSHIPDGNAPYSEWSAQAKKDLSFLTSLLGAKSSIHTFLKIKKQIYLKVEKLDLLSFKIHLLEVLFGTMKIEKKHKIQII